MKFQIARVCCASLAVAALASGCVPLVVGGGAMMGTMSAVDRRTTGAQIDDQGIELRAANRISQALPDKTVHINVTSYNRQVLLTGEVPAAADSQKAEQIVLGVDNVRSTVNDLGVMPASTLSERSKDSYITGKVRAGLVDAKDLSANTFKVVTERGVVYLMGRVTEREAARATEITRGVDGVRKVVRIFETIPEEEARQPVGKPPAEPAAR
jgi:osmotically-inducible protein OsmY